MVNTSQNIKAITSSKTWITTVCILTKSKKRMLQWVAGSRGSNGPMINMKNSVSIIVVNVKKHRDRSDAFLE